MLAVAPEAVMKEVEFLYENSPPWELEPEFEVRPVNFPQRAPIKHTPSRYRPELAMVGA
jgi:hypothetical protein